MSLFTVPTATAPARLTLPPPGVLALLLANWVCDCVAGPPGVVAPPLVDLATAVSVFCVSALTSIDAASTVEPLSIEARVMLSCAVPITATPRETPLPPTVVDPSAIAVAIEMLVALRFSSSPALTMAPDITRVLASLVRKRPAIEPSVAVEAVFAALMALACTSDVALALTSPVAVMLPVISTRAEASA